MPRYLVERTHPNHFDILPNEAGQQRCQTIIANDALEKVTWLHSYVTLDGRKSFCVCDAPTPEAVRRAVESTSGLSIASPKCVCSIRISSCHPLNSIVWHNYASVMSECFNRASRVTTGDDCWPDTGFPPTRE